MKILILALFSALGSQLYSQGNLQFNQVLTFTGSVSTVGPAGVSSGSQTVPTGKVWKIESIGGYAPNVIGTSNVRYGVMINGAFVASFISGSNISISSCPIWLKQGDVFHFYYYNPNGITNSCSFAISLIEFNIIP